MRHLESLGMLVVATNLRVGRLEVDVVARDGRVLALVEVRTRGPSAWTSGFGSIDYRKRLYIRRAGERLWQRTYKHDVTIDRIRFDAASVTFEGDDARVEYVKAAF